MRNGARAGACEPFCLLLCVIRLVLMWTTVMHADRCISDAGKEPKGCGEAGQDSRFPGGRHYRSQEGGAWQHRPGVAPGDDTLGRAWGILRLRGRVRESAGGEQVPPRMRVSLRPLVGRRMRFGDGLPLVEAEGQAEVYPYRYRALCSRR